MLHIISTKCILSEFFLIFVFKTILQIKNIYCGCYRIIAEHGNTTLHKRVLNAVRMLVYANPLKHLNKF